ncbi:DUF805 domain-containing protein [Luteipulveratus mongoliensis]|uniref:Membrane protein n=1 Tax=Luteipulveratus mongoliensis TaxID=571913 RepID=A0A0K1JDY5_9MICO|nr:DUF805 domain-containing protein [Luteipulveratus mongoliensis]AKU14803.1 membrane protein [Luteipulveratus mongoliensis]
MDYYTSVIKRYVDFSGRARRKEFWMYTLINWIISIVLSIVDKIIGTDFGNGGGLLAGLYALAVFLPSLGVAVRRLHDTNRSGWWVLIGLIPVIGFIVLILFWIKEGDPHPNEHGPDPKAGERALPAAG